MSEARKSFYILLPLLAVLITLLMAELAFSLFYPIPFSLEKNMYYEPDPHTGFRHRPLAEGKYLNGVPAVANSHGLRDAEVAIPKPAGTRRILLLGDSFTAGANVAEDVAYPQVLERLLSESELAPVEVINTGTGGWSPFQYAQYLEYYGAEYEPDLILVGFFVGNDTYVDRFAVGDTLTAVLGRRVSRQTGQSAWGTVKVFAYERSHIARLLMKQGFESIEFERDDCSDFNDYFIGVQKQRLVNHNAVPSSAELALLDGNVGQLARIQSWAEQRGIPLVVFVFPDENQINPALQRVVMEGVEPGSIDFAQPQALLGARLDALGIAWADLRVALSADSRCLFMNDSHWVPAGHEVVARYMRDYIVRQGLLRR